MTIFGIQKEACYPNSVFPGNCLKEKKSGNYLPMHKVHLKSFPWHQAKDLMSANYIQTQEMM